MIGLWKIKSGKGFVSHHKGLNQEQVAFFHNMKVGDRLVLFENDVRAGENAPQFTLKRSNLKETNDSAV